MRKIVVPLIIALSMLVFSCSTTKPFTDQEMIESDLTLSEKLEAYGGKKVTVDDPLLYFDGSVWLEDMTRMVEEAEDYILLSTFLGSSCPNLEPLFDAIVKKAEEGVRVYVIIDGTSSLDMTESKFVMTNLSYLREKGVNLLIYSPISFSHLINPVQIIIRDHRKMMVIDGKTAAIGGMNINFISMGAGEKTQRDSMYVFSSPSLSSLLIDEFVKIWNEGSVDYLNVNSFKKYTTEEEGNDAWLFNRNVYSGDVSIAGMFATLINEAESSIFLCPYLPTVDDRMALSLRMAKERGVDVEIWCSQDSRGYAKAGSSWAVAELIKDTGATFHEVTYSQDGELLPMYHMKMMVVDDRYIVIGSSNFNYRSMTLSHEIALVVDSPFFAKAAKEAAMLSAGEGVILTEEDALKAKKEYGDLFAYLFSYFGG